MPKPDFNTLKKIAVLCGGKSLEREVSLRSGKACFESLTRLGYNTKIIDITGADKISLLLNWKPDMAFLVTHGEHGEDGALQGMLDWAEIPYTGANVQASALCMDKYLCKLLLKENNIPLTPITLLNKNHRFETLCKQWNCSEIFAKPRWGGSSVNSSKIASQTELDVFIQKKSPFVIEPYFKGREMTVGLLASKDTWTTLPLLELIPKGDFYDYHSKYTEGQTQFILPAQISTQQKDLILSVAKKCLQICGVSGYARVDFLVSEKEFIVLEINTLPGMTKTSDVPAQAKEAGISFDQLVEILLKSACA